ncbi:hypothetical protein H5410_005369 [Solanum commersonii]|uniref:Uncharacterized protein n=1 Tax=Solanum commersonii TaxID=4109 RepID=A0A9J6A814_SOLCO|nr:hypothetical protein H5410_005369 [Solanum commersonii]
MEDFIQAHDYELWMRVTDGPFIPMMKDDEGKKGGNYEKKFPLSKEKESDIAMYVAWGTGSDNSIEDNIEDVALMAMEDSESNIEKKEEKRKGWNSSFGGENSFWSNQKSWKNRRNKPA